MRANPFGRVLAIGERGASLFLGGALFASILVHSGFALAAYIRELDVTPPQPTCRAGETLQLEAFARPAVGSTIRVTNSATWSVSDGKVVSHAGGGFLRCVSEGTTTVTATYLNKATTLTVKVEPPLMMVDVKEEEPPPPPPPPPIDEAPQPQAPTAEQPKDTPAPAAAKAGNLLTAPDDSKPAPGDDPVSFVTDPNGDEYGSGTVAKGGTAEHGAPGAQASGVPGGTGSGSPGKGPLAAPPPAVVAASDLSRKPALPAGYTCKNFPAEADDDVANVQVLVTVKASGEVGNVSVMNENPKGQGFGKSARTCILATRLTPGLDKDGKAVGTTIAINLHFTR